MADSDMRTGPYRHLNALLLAAVGCRSDFELPPLIADSQYIDYHTDAEATIICMDELLANEDHFIEHVAAVLAVDAPASAIDFVWDPVQDGSEPWACADSVDACYRHREEDNLDVVVSRTVSHHHELVHAVGIPALGKGHPVLEEGLAEYLGTLNHSTFTSDTFPAAFKDIVASSTETTMDYHVAMHFVGSIFTRHGAAKYLALRARMPGGAGLEKFAEVFEAVFEQSLDDALVEMGTDPVYGVDILNGCGDDEAPKIEWTSETSIDTKIKGVCGDPGFYGAGVVDGLAGFYGRYIIDVAEAGHYELTVGGGTAGFGPLRGLLTSCSPAMAGSGLISLGGETGDGSLQPGRYSLGIAFSAGPEAVGAATVQLEYVAPTP